MSDMNIFNNDTCEKMIPKNCQCLYLDYTNMDPTWRPLFHNRIAMNNPTFILLNVYHWVFIYNKELFENKLSNEFIKAYESGRKHYIYNRNYHDEILHKIIDDISYIDVNQKKLYKKVLIQTFSRGCK